MDCIKIEPGAPIKPGQCVTIKDGKAYPTNSPTIYTGTFTEKVVTLRGHGGRERKKVKRVPDEIPNPDYTGPPDGTYIGGGMYCFPSALYFLHDSEDAQ